MNNKAILIIDDNSISLKFIQVLLNAEGYSVQSATNADEALKSLQISHPDLILMDLQLPDIDGLELTRQIKADPATRDIQIIAFTAYNTLIDEDEARQAGCSGFISKPVKSQIFSRQIADYLLHG